MKESNKEIFKRYESNLRTATYSDYTRNLTQSALVSLEEAYKDETGIIKPVFTSYSCGVCILNGLKQIGKWYYSLPVEEPQKPQPEPVKVSKPAVKPTKSNKHSK